MPRFVDLSHPIVSGMPGARFAMPDGRVLECALELREVLSHEQSRPLYDGKAEFAFTEMRFHTSMGTYLDSPYARYRDRRDVGALAIEELVLPGLRLDLTHVAAGEPVEAPALEAALARAGAGEIDGRAVLCEFGWDRFWGRPEYSRYPFLGRTALRRLLEGGARLLGVDTGNVDSAADPERPAHSWLLRRDVFVVENLRNLARLGRERFRFYAVPVAVKGASSMPVRAFAELAQQ